MSIFQPTESLLSACRNAARPSQRMRHIGWRALAITALVLCVTGANVAAKEPVELLRESRRIVFLGDSITFAGEYVADVEAWLLTQPETGPRQIINVGLPSETISGLSEEGHADGKFPRPHLAERLARVLERTRPDLVIACYGINCGIYQPFDADRFAMYKLRMVELKNRVEAVGATFVVMTPPFYDGQQGPKLAYYNDVLARYAAWLLEQRQEGWRVIDLHGPMTAEVARRRLTDPGFTFQPDAVHPNSAGQWFVAQQLIRWFGDEAAARAESPEALLKAAGISPEVLPLVRQRMALIRDAYLSAAGHTRPGIKAGLPLPEAEEKAAELTKRISELARSR